MESFKGEIEQIPPMYSALKVGGKKLYDLAREGIEIERKIRKVKIYDIKLLSFDFPKASIEVTCSKGTYIRTLVDDIGIRLGTFAHVENLERSRVGKLDIKDSIKSADILEIPKEELIKKLRPLDIALDHLERLDIDKKYLENLINGQKILTNKQIDGEIRIYIDNDFIGLAKIASEDGRNFLKMEKVFYER